MRGRIVFLFTRYIIFPFFVFQNIYLSSFATHSYTLKYTNNNTGL